MHGHPAHRHGFAVMFAARGQRDVEHAGGDPGILEEQFEEIAHAVEQQRVACLALEREILLHHRSGLAGHEAGLAGPLPIRESPGAPFPL